MANRIPELTNVAVLMGGWSVEREVSLMSGKACTKALEEVGFRVTQVDADSPGVFKRIDVVDPPYIPPA